MRVAVTGIDGFVGRAVGPALEARGHELVPIARRLGHDVTRADSLATVPAFDAVIHLGVTSVPASYADPRAFYEANVLGTLNVLELARHVSARVVFASSYVYGQPRYQPIDEAHPTQAFNPYAQSKLLGEALCTAYARDFGTKVTIIRPFNVFGPGQGRQFLVPRLVQQICEGSEVSVTDLRPRRDYVHVRDVASALVSAASIDRREPSVFNVGSGRSVGIEELVALISRLSGRTAKITCTHQPRPNEVLDTVCDARRAHAELGWEPTITLEAGLQEMIADASR